MTANSKIDPLLSLLEIPPGYLNVMKFEDESEVHGLGHRFVVELQGCHHRCSDCSNPVAWSFGINELISIDRLFQIIVSHPNHNGVTFAGGEPFWQAPALAILAEQLRAVGLNTMAYTGFTLERLQAPYAPAGTQALLDQLDLLVDCPTSGIYASDTPASSRKQHIHILNPALENRLTWARDEQDNPILLVIYP